MKDPYNPFNDKSLHTSVSQTESVSLDEKAPFNDVIKHGDIIQGFQAPKRIDQLPRWFRNPKRIFATISLLVFASFIIYIISTYFTTGK